MIILIDGYNVLKQVSKDSLVSEYEREQFINLLAKYAKKKKHKIVLVFDGGHFDWSHKERVGGVQVVYSGLHESADDYIMGFVETHKTKELLLVTSDKDLMLFAATFNIPSVRSLEFYAFLQSIMKKKSDLSKVVKADIVKLSDERNPELDALMLESSEKIPIKKEDQPDTEIDNLKFFSTQRHGRLSKKELKLIEKIKKL